jgi:hypothetical protein
MVAAVLATWTGQALAIDVTNSGTTLFFDNLESQTLNAPPTTAGMPDPGLGTWSAAGAHNVRDNTVGPGPFSGSQYLQVGPTTNFQTSKATFDSTQNSGDIHVEYMLYIPATNLGPFGFQLFNQSGDDGSRLLRWQITNVSAAGGDIQDGATSATGPFLGFDVWNLVEIDHTLGSSTYDITVTPDGGVASSATHNGIMGTGLTSMGFASFDNNHAVYIDDIPEPATLTLLGLVAGPLFLARRRRSA